MCHYRTEIQKFRMLALVWTECSETEKLRLVCGKSQWKRVVEWGGGESGIWISQQMLPQLCTDHLTRSFSCSEVQLGNTLPSDLWQATSLHHFKSKLNHHRFKTKLNKSSGKFSLHLISNFVFFCNRRWWKIIYMYVFAQEFVLWVEIWCQLKQCCLKLFQEKILFHTSIS